MSVNEKMTAIADAIREYGNLDSSLSLDDMATNIPIVHDQGYQDGHTEGFEHGQKMGLTEGEAQGRKAERDAFWEMLQEGGNRTDYQHAFRQVFTDATFVPKYNITPTNANQMFVNCKITNLKALLEAAGVVLDTSQARFITQMFQNSTITHIPVIDCTASSQVSAVFSDMVNLVYIEKLIVAEKHTFPNTFSSDKELAEIRIEGTIASDISFQWSPLSRASIESIVGCLSDSVSGKIASFKKTAVLAAFGSEANWTAYIAAKPNWNFTLS